MERARGSDFRTAMRVALHWFGLVGEPRTPTKHQLWLNAVASMAGLGLVLAAGPGIPQIIGAGLLGGGGAAALRGGIHRRRYGRGIRK
jgi:hypothetical protein